ncbi:MAG: ATP-grasp domain-containing protein [Deltaproteobacteria bacterium]|nr:ATP-grasp domain-containing protein [Deltaproteobacteria bacterium]
MSKNREAVLFVENTNIRKQYLYSVAKAAKKRGFLALFAKSSNVESPPDGIFDIIIDWDAFTISDLEKLITSFSKTYFLKAVVNVTRLFSRDGLIAAPLAEAAKKAGLRHHSTDALFRTNNKYLMRDMLRHADCRTVAYALIQNEKEALTAARQIGYPVILKPISGAGSTLVFKCDNEEHLLRYTRQILERLPHVHFNELNAFSHFHALASGHVVFFEPNASLLLEKYISGIEFSVECLADEEEVFPLLIHEKLRIRETPGVVYEDLLISPPTSFNPSQQLEIKKYAARIAKALHLKNTFAHIEMRWEPGVGPQVIEVNPRIGGGQVVQSLQTFLGIDPYEVELDLMMGTHGKRAYPLRTTALHAMFFFFPPRAGFLKSVDGLEKISKLPGVLSVEQSYETGPIYGDEEECFLVQCWMKAESLQQVYDTYERSLKQITMHMI